MFNFSDLCSLKQLLLTLDIFDREGIRKHEVLLIEGIINSFKRQNSFLYLAIRMRGV